MFTLAAAAAADADEVVREEFGKVLRLRREERIWLLWEGIEAKLICGLLACRGVICAVGMETYAHLLHIPLKISCLHRR